MKLYYSRGACSLVVRILLNEIGLESTFEAVNLKTKKTETNEDFLAINSKGSVPTLQLNNGEILTENAVILQYLAEHSKATQLLPPVSDFNRYRVLEWLNYITTELHKGFSPLFNPAIEQEVKDKVLIPSLKNKFNYLNNHLKSQKYVCGDHFTLPDPYLYVMIRWGFLFKFNLQEWEHLERYFSELSERKSIQTSLKQEELPSLR